MLLNNVVSQLQTKQSELYYCDVLYKNGSFFYSAFKYVIYYYN